MTNNSPTWLEKLLGGSLCLAALALGIWAAVWTKRSAAESESLPQRRAKVDQLDAAKKLALREKQERFSNLDAAKRQRLRELHQALAEQQDGDELREVMHDYYDWLISVSDTRRNELLKLRGKPEKRAALVEREQDRRAPLSPGDRRALYVWWRKHVMRGEWSMSRDPNRFRRELERQYASIDPKKIAELLATLSESAGRRLNKQPNLEEQRNLIAIWFWNMRRHSRPQVSDEKLTEFFSKLNPQERNELLHLSPEERNSRLRFKYLFGSGRGPDGNRSPRGRPKSGGPRSSGKE